MESTSRASVIREIVRVHLRELKRRATSGELVPVIRARGVVLPGDNPRAIVASVLAAASEFDNIKGEGYGLRDWALAGP